MNYEIPNFTARMKVCKDLKLVEKNVESQDSTFFLRCGWYICSYRKYMGKNEERGDKYKY